MHTDAHGLKAKPQMTAWADRPPGPVRWLGQETGHNKTVKESPTLIQ